MALSNIQCVKKVVEDLPKGIVKLGDFYVNVNYHIQEYMYAHNKMKELGFIHGGYSLSGFLPTKDMVIPVKEVEVCIEKLPDNVIKLGEQYIITAQANTDAFEGARKAMEKMGFVRTIFGSYLPKSEEQCYYLFGIESGRAKRCLPEGSIAYYLHEFLSFL